MTNQTATKRPWYVDPYDQSVIMIPDKINDCVKLADFHYDVDIETAIANCQYTAHCVNQHDKLVEALKYIAGHTSACLDMNELGKQAGLRNCRNAAIDALSAESEAVNE